MRELTCLTISNFQLVHIHVDRTKSRWGLTAERRKGVCDHYSPVGVSVVTIVCKSIHTPFIASLTSFMSIYSTIADSPLNLTRWWFKCFFFVVFAVVGFWTSIGHRFPIAWKVNRLSRERIEAVVARVPRITGNSYPLASQNAWSNTIGRFCIIIVDCW